MFGHKVKKVNYNPGNSINLTDLEKGNYLLEIVLPENKKRLKLIHL
jgi:hypothetical protein